MRQISGWLSEWVKKSEQCVTRGHLHNVLLQFCGPESENIITLIDLPDTAVVKMITLCIDRNKSKRYNSTSSSPTKVYVAFLISFCYK